MNQKEGAKKANAVFEGGGVKGTGLIGALKATENLGYEFEHLAGTSAGAIVACMIAAGYKADEMNELLMDLDYLQFKDEGALSKIPVAGPALSILIEKGIYKGDFFEKWLRLVLLKKGVSKFRDLAMEEHINNPRYKYRLQVVASDITRGKMLVLPQDISYYGINPDELDVARAVRMSMSIPYFFMPAVVRKNRTKSYLVDGGILSNFPVWLFDEDKLHSSLPTFGYKLVDPNENKPHKIFGPVTLFAAMFSTMMEAHDARYIQDHNFLRTIPIPTLGIQTTDFGITKEQKRALFKSGFSAAKKFFEEWDFTDYKKRQELEVGRREKLLLKK